MFWKRSFLEGRAKYTNRVGKCSLWHVTLACSWHRHNTCMVSVCQTLCSTLSHGHSYASGHVIVLKRCLRPFSSWLGDSNMDRPSGPAAITSEGWGLQSQVSGHGEKYPLDLPACCYRTQTTSNALCWKKKTTHTHNYLKPTHSVWTNVLGSRFICKNVALTQNWTHVWASCLIMASTLHSQSYTHVQIIVSNLGPSYL